MNVLFEELLFEIYKFRCQNIDVLYNSWYGKFNLSNEAYKLYKKKSNKKVNILYLSRHDPILVKVFKKLKSKFNQTDSHAGLISIPKNTLIAMK